VLLTESVSAVALYRTIHNFFNLLVKSIPSAVDRLSKGLLSINGR
jgi:hypothetical protein